MGEFLRLLILARWCSSTRFVKITIWRNKNQFYYSQGGDSLAPSNFRPITIPSNLLRLLTVRMCEIMTNLCEENNILGQEQFGFRRKRSTVDAVFVLSTLIKKAKLKRWPFATAFLDISKVAVNPYHTFRSQKCQNFRPMTASGDLHSSRNYPKLGLVGRPWPSFNPCTVMTLWVSSSMVTTHLSFGWPAELNKVCLHQQTIYYLHYFISQDVICLLFCLPFS